MHLGHVRSFYIQGQVMVASRKTEQLKLQEAVPQAIFGQQGFCDYTWTVKLRSTPKVPQLRCASCPHPEPWVKTWARTLLCGNFQRKVVPRLPAPWSVDTASKTNITAKYGTVHNNTGCFPYLWPLHAMCSHREAIIILLSGNEIPLLWQEE